MDTGFHQGPKDTANILGQSGLCSETISQHPPPHTRKKSRAGLKLQEATVQHSKSQAGCTKVKKGGGLSWHGQGLSKTRVSTQVSKGSPTPQPGATLEVCRAEQPLFGPRGSRQPCAHGPSGSMPTTHARACPCCSGLPHPTHPTHSHAPWCSPGGLGTPEPYHGGRAWAGYRVAAALSPRAMRLFVRSRCHHLPEAGRVQAPAGKGWSLGEGERGNGEVE